MFYRDLIGCFSYPIEQVVRRVITRQFGLNHSWLVYRKSGADSKLHDSLGGASVPVGSVIVLGALVLIVQNWRSQAPWCVCPTGIFDEDSNLVLSKAACLTACRAVDDGFPSGSSASVESLR